MNTMTKQTGAYPYHCAQNHMSKPNFNQNNSVYNKTVDIKKGENMGAIATISQQKEACQTTNNFTQEEIQTLKNCICKGISDDELKIFIMACNRTKLDPFMKQIYAIPRRSKKDGQWVESMTIQTSIDGYRLIAERTSRYAPGGEPTYVYDQSGRLLSATSYIKKLTHDGTWHTVSSSAHIDEYMQTFQDRQTGEKKPTGMWVNMPRTMLAKCAEAQALRKAFPAEMSGVYTKEEMQQADPEIIQSAPIERISEEQATELDHILGDCNPDYKNWLLRRLKSDRNISSIRDIPVDAFDRTKQAAIKNMDQYRAMQQLKAIEAGESMEVSNEC